MPQSTAARMICVFGAGSSVLRRPWLMLSCRRLASARNQHNATICERFGFSAERRRSAGWPTPTAAFPLVVCQIMVLFLPAFKHTSVTPAREPIHSPQWSNQIINKSYLFFLFHSTDPHWETQNDKVKHFADLDSDFSNPEMIDWLHLWRPIVERRAQGKFRLRTTDISLEKRQTGRFVLWNLRNSSSNWPRNFTNLSLTAVSSTIPQKDHTAILDRNSG